MRRTAQVSVLGVPQLARPLESDPRPRSSIHVEDLANLYVVALNPRAIIGPEGESPARTPT